MRLMMQERNSLTREVAKRYKDATKKDKETILNECVKSTGLSKKHAVEKIKSAKVTMPMGF